MPATTLSVGDHVTIPGQNDALATIYEVDNEHYEVITLDEGFDVYRLHHSEVCAAPDSQYRPTEGDRVVINEPDESMIHGRVGEVMFDDKSTIPYKVRFNDNPNDWIWVYEGQVAPVDKDTPVGYRRITDGTPVAENTLIYVPEGTIGHNRKPVPSGTHITYAEKDAGGDLPMKVGGSMYWPKATDCFISPERSSKPKATRAPEIGDRVVIYKPHGNRKRHGQTGILREDDGSTLPYRVEIVGTHKETRE